MYHTHNSISLRGNIQAKKPGRSKRSLLRSKEVIATCASVQEQNHEGTPKQICSNIPSLHNEIKIEYNEIYFEETNIHSKDIEIKKECEELETQSELLPICFTDVNCDVKIEYDNPSEDPLNDVSYFTKYKLYKCDICNADFYHKQNLKRHQRVHREPKPPRKLSSQPEDRRRSPDRSNKSNVYCSVAQCGTYYTAGIGMHHFPKCKDIRKKWQIALNITRKITESMVVCSQHFKQTDYYLGLIRTHVSRRRLLKNAIPSMNLPDSNFQQVKIGQKKQNKLATFEYFTEVATFKNFTETGLSILQKVYHDHSYL